MTTAYASAILALHNKGWSHRRISRELGIHRETVANHVKKARIDGRSQCHGTGSGADGVGKRGRRPSACEPYRDLILEQIALGCSAQRIHQVLVKQRSFVGSYDTVKRFVHSCKQASANVASAGNETSCDKWMLDLLQGTKSASVLSRELRDDQLVASLLPRILRGGLKARNKALAILAVRRGISVRRVSRFLRVQRATVTRYVLLYTEQGPIGLFRRTKRRKKSDDPRCRDAVISMLHSPPSTHGINRTTWKQNDLKRVIRREKGLHVSRRTIRSILRKAGYRWRKARRVLTSNDPEYREKLERIKSILSTIGPSERFFSADEFGPFHITKKPGRKLVAPGETHVIPQRQKSKGRLIVTAALELCTNQVTHFYSARKNTAEMIRLLNSLLAEYRAMDTLYLSWDAASWHLSKKFHEEVAEVNRRWQLDGTVPRIELAPLPACAQFLNVIESVFSGMARAIIHNSDYASAQEAMEAIDRYFQERNDSFKRNPRRAGNKIWGQELVTPVFSEAHNCKDPRW